MVNLLCQYGADVNFFGENRPYTCTISQVLWRRQLSDRAAFRQIIDTLAAFGANFQLKINQSISI